MRRIRARGIVVTSVRVGGRVIEATPSAEDSKRQQLVDLYETNFDALYRYCLARTGDPHYADDAASEAFLAAARTLAANDGANVDRPWLFVVARNRIVDQWRRAERHRRRVARLIATWEKGSPASPGSDEGAGEMSENVLAALRSLPERQRAAVVMCYLDECSVSEIAEAMEIDYRAAESLLARGRRSFKKAWTAR